MLNPNTVNVVDITTAKCQDCHSDFLVFTYMRPQRLLSFNLFSYFIPLKDLKLMNKY